VAESASQATIRKYKSEDREALRKICYDTGLMGEPIDPYFGCMELFADYWMNYYTDYEPESAFVAEIDGKIIGYLVGCKDTSTQQEVQNNEIMPLIRRKLFTLKYGISRQFFNYMWRYLRSMWRGEFADERVGPFPAHLHMNLSDGCRGKGIGSKLVATYLDYLRENDIKGVHLGTTTANKMAVPFYGKWGFQVASRRRLTMYDGILPGEVEELLFTREIT
jgi:GNAT superfamily N-acetyltransferase